MVNVKIGNITSSNFAIGKSNEVKGNTVNVNSSLNHSDVEALREELLFIKKQLREGTQIYKAVDDVIQATDINEITLVKKIKEHAVVFTSSLIVNLISSGVYDLIKYILNS